MTRHLTLPSVGPRVAGLCDPGTHLMSVDHLAHRLMRSVMDISTVSSHHSKDRKARGDTIAVPDLLRYLRSTAISL